LTKKIKELEELLNKKDNIIISLEKEKDLLIINFLIEIKNIFNKKKFIKN